MPRCHTMSRIVTDNGGSEEGGPTKKPLGRTAELLLVALLRQPTVKDAAAECGVTERTVFRYLQNPDFRERYKAARRGAIDDAVRELQGKSLQAVEALARNLTCGNAFAENTAAQMILAHAIKGVELQDLQSEVEEIKRLLAAQEAGGKGKGLREAGT